jgi:two-component system sensor kinase FixL
MDGSRLWARLEATVVPHAEGGPECRLVMSDVTDKKLAEEALEKTRRMLAETERLGKVGGWELDIESNHLTWTNEIYRIHEVDLTFEPTVEDAIAFYAPAYRPLIARAVQRAMELGEPFDVELEIIAANGTLKTVHSIGRADFAHRRISGFFQDITAQKQAELTLRDWNQILEDRVADRTRDLQQSEARFRQLAETTFEGIAISQGGKLIDGNARLGEMHGYSLAEMIGRPVTDFVAPESLAKVTEHIRIGHEATYEFLGLRKDGSTFPAESHSRMGTWHGTSSLFTALRDLTESKRLAAKLQTQQTDLEHAQQLALISEVCAGIVHQISQPLCAMGANLAVIQTRLTAAPQTDGETLEILKDIIDSVACIREVMHHMRTLLQTKRPTYLPTDCHRLLADTLPLLRPEAENRGIMLAVELAPDLPLVLADAVQLKQVILNLTRNAFDACLTGPPDRRQVFITTRVLADTAVELCVRDSGAGIAPEAIDHLFAPFFTTKAGMGIGLRLSRTIVEANGGRIEASNNADGIGASFRVTLPGLPPASPA